MNQDIFEWLLILGRWLHITAAITWIGTSIFFMWLDRTLKFNENSKREGHTGELWMVHGGGFYHVEKLLMGPVKVPEHLHWFKWESYWTWLSGFFLVLMIFYTGNGTFLLDSSVSGVTYWQAVGIGVFSLVGSWLFYDFLWERELTKKKPIIGHILTLLWFAGMTYFLCHKLSGRAAYIHIGGMLGTWMTANVFLRIIPRQVKMVEASKRGEPVNQDWGKNAKNRSTHNTYFTLPVIFIMLSNHFPSTYGHEWNWLILLAMSAAGASIREYFVQRESHPARANAFGAIGLLLIVAIVVSTVHRTSTPQTSVNTSVTHAEGPTVDVVGFVKREGPVILREKFVVPLACTDKEHPEILSNEFLIHEGGRIQNVLVHITKGLEGKAYESAIPQETVQIDQKNCQYVPRVTAVRAGQKVEFLNSDPILHNVRSIAKSNENFNDIMPSKNDKISKIFNQVEILQTKCSVHPWMSASVAVIDHPFFSVTNEKGEFAIKGLPVGSYTLEAWHESLGTVAMDITVKEGDAPHMEFTFGQARPK